MSGRIRDKFLTFLIRRPADKGIAFIFECVLVQIRERIHVVGDRDRIVCAQLSAVAVQRERLVNGICRQRLSAICDIKAD